MPEDGVPKGRLVANIYVVVYNDRHLVEHHLSGPPEGVGGLDGLTGVGFTDFNYGYVVGDTRRRQVEVQGFGNHRQPKGSQKDFLYGVCYIGVFLRGNTYQSGRIYRSLSVGYAAEVEYRIEVGKGIKAGMVSKRPFHKGFFLGLYISFQDKIAIFRHHKFYGKTGNQRHRPVPKKAGEHVFVYAVRQGGGGAKGVDGVSAQTDGHRKTGILAGGKMTGSGFVFVPVHARAVFAKDLHPVHAYIPPSGFRVLGVYQRQGNKAPSVVGPALKYGQEA